MKAARFSQFGGPEVLEIVDLPDPHPGLGQVRIAVRAAGINPSDWKKRKGLMDRDLPQTMGYEAARVVDELGEGVADVAVRDRVFGVSTEGAAQAELAVLSYYAPIPPSVDFPGAAGLPVAIETATRALDQLGVASGSEVQQRGRWPRGPRARRDRRVDRVWALLAPGRADLPSRRDRGGAPCQRGRARAREARAGGRPRRRRVLRLGGVVGSRSRWRIRFRDGGFH